MSSNRAQHFVPRAYLREFVDPKKKGRLWVYEQAQDVRPMLPSEIAHQRDFYSFPAKEERTNVVDDYLTKLESEATPILRQFAERDVLESNQAKAILAEFIGMMSARVPAARNLTGDIAAQPATKKLREATKDTELFRAAYEKIGLRLKEPLPFEELRAKLISGYQFREVSKVNSLRRMLNMGWMNAAYLLEMNWVIRRSQGDEFFVTSDNPVVSVLPDGRGRATPGVAFSQRSVHIVFPLNPGACLLASRSTGKRSQEVVAAWVRSVNKVVMSMAERWLFASEKSKKIQEIFDKVGCSVTFADDFYKIPDTDPLVVMP